MAKRTLNLKLPEEVWVAKRAYDVAVKNKHEITDHMRWGMREYGKARNRADPWRKKLQNLRAKAKREGVPFSLSKKDLPAMVTCPVFGTTLVLFNEGKALDTSASVDRLVPSVGYVPGNITVISFLANRIKQNATAAEIIAVAEWLNAPEIALNLNVANKKQKQAFSAAKYRAKKQGLPFSLTPGDVIWPNLCPVLKIPLTYGGKLTEASGSLNMYVRAQGYVKGNVFVMSHKAMRIRQNATPEQIRKVGEWLQKVEAAVGRTLKEVT